MLRVMGMRVLLLIILNVFVIDTTATLAVTEPVVDVYVVARIKYSTVVVVVVPIAVVLDEDDFNGLLTFIIFKLQQNVKYFQSL